MSLCNDPAEGSSKAAVQGPVEGSSKVAVQGLRRCFARTLRVATFHRTLQINLSKNLLVTFQSGFALSEQCFPKKLRSDTFRLKVHL